MRVRTNDPRNAEREIIHIAAWSCSKRPASDHIVSIVLMDTGHFLLRSRIGEHDYTHMFTPETMRAVMEMCAFLFTKEQP